MTTTLRREVMWSGSLPEAVLQKVPPLVLVSDIEVISVLHELNMDMETEEGALIFKTINNQ